MGHSILTYVHKQVFEESPILILLDYLDFKAVHSRSGRPVNNGPNRPFLPSNAHVQVIAVC